MEAEISPYLKASVFLSASYWCGWSKVPYSSQAILTARSTTILLDPNSLSVQQIELVRMFIEGKATTIKGRRPSVTVNVAGDNLILSIAQDGH